MTFWGNHSALRGFYATGNAAGNRALNINCGSRHRRRIVAQQAYRLIAGVAEDASHRPSLVVVIYDRALNCKVTYGASAALRQPHGTISVLGKIVASQRLPSISQPVIASNAKTTCVVGLIGMTFRAGS